VLTCAIGSLGAALPTSKPPEKVSSLPAAAAANVPLMFPVVLAALVLLFL
jgi:hypothetical protein